MAGALNRLVRTAALAASLAAIPAFGEGMDPTRPPAGMAEGAPAAAMAGAAGAAAPATSGLQQIIRRAGGKPAAVINGQRVELGGRVGEARLVEVREDAVVLRGASGRETLYLTPGIGKQTAKEPGRGREKAKP